MSLLPSARYRILWIRGGKHLIYLLEPNQLWFYLALQGSALYEIFIHKGGLSLRDTHICQGSGTRPNLIRGTLSDLPEAKHDWCVCEESRRTTLTGPCIRKCILGSTGRILILSSLYNKSDISCAYWFCSFVHLNGKNNQGLQVIETEKLFPALWSTRYNLKKNFLFSCLHKLQH